MNEIIDDEELDERKDIRSTSPEADPNFAQLCSVIDACPHLEQYWNCDGCRRFSRCLKEFESLCSTAENGRGLLSFKQLVVGVTKIKGILKYEAKR